MRKGRFAEATKELIKDYNSLPKWLRDLT